MIDPEALIKFLSNITPQAAYLLAVYLLWQKLNKAEERYIALVNQYHEMLIEQVEILTQLKDRLNGK